MMEPREMVAYVLLFMILAGLVAAYLRLTRYGRGERRLERLAERARKARRKQRRREAGTPLGG